MSHLSEEELTKLAERERMRPALPLTNWEAISTQLREEGIIGDAAGRRRPAEDRWLRAAAAVLLVAGGAVAGRYVGTGASLPTSPAAQSVAARNVSSVAQRDAQSFASEKEAWDMLNRAGAEYQRASEYLASRDATRPTDSTSVYQARLAALDGMTSASRTALYAAPHDPVINQYYLAAQGAREATIRQLGTSLPEGVQLLKW